MGMGYIYRKKLNYFFNMNRFPKVLPIIHTFFRLFCFLLQFIIKNMHSTKALLVCWDSIFEMVLNHQHLVTEKLLNENINKFVLTSLRNKSAQLS